MKSHRRGYLKDENTHTRWNLKDEITHTTHTRGYLKDGEHDAAEGSVVGEVCRSEDVEAPVV